MGDTLGAEYKDSKTVLIADVDCTAAGKPLCDKYGVRGYPTIKYFNPPDEEGEDYKGGRTLADLQKFAAEKLKEDSAPKIKLLKAATPKADAPAKEAAKDEM